METAYLDLIRGGDPQAVLATAHELQERPDRPPPAAVLAAQAQLAQGDCVRVVDGLATTVADRPQYVAAQLLVGRCREELGDLPAAASAYSHVAALHPLAEARLARIGWQARDAGVERVQGWIAEGRLDEARRELAELQRWAPSDLETSTAVSRLAATLGDHSLELEILRDLAANGLGDRSSLERQAKLELDVGDAGAGLAILEDLRARFPEDGQIAAALDRARFAWRMTMLPEAAQALESSVELNRGQLAVLLYWVFPGVRYTRPDEAIIANDVLDHVHRTEIVRIANLGIMDVDANLHAFRPAAAAQRLDALRALLKVLSASSESGACLDGVTVSSSLSVESTCLLAARCGLLDEPAECLPRAVLSGSTAMLLAGRAARRLESR